MTKQETQRRTNRALLITSAILFAFVIWVANLPKSEATQAKEAQPSTKTSASCSDSGMAYIMSQNFVKPHLKDEASAKFPPMKEVHAVKRGECRYQIKSIVTAKNGFGGFNKAHYSIEMEYDPAKKLWAGRNLRIE